MNRSSLIQLVVFSGAVAALGVRPMLAQSAEEVRMTVGKTIVIDYPADIRQVAASDPTVIDFNTATMREVVVNAKGLGSATLVVWSKDGQRSFYSVTVDLNLDPLRRLLKDSFPSEDIQPRSSRDSISLNGHISSKDVADRAMLLAAPFAKVVVNNMQLPSAPVDKQILLRVKFAELDRSRESQFGINILSAGASNTLGRISTGQFASGSASIDQLNTVSPSPGNGISSEFKISDLLNIFAFRPDLDLGAFIKALESESILQILAEPNLVTTNGKEANFIVGGEFPVPILQGGSNSGAVTVQFREFGIRLLFTPNITENKTIKMHLKQEVSDLDKTNGVTLNGFFIPALSTRRAETDVELGEGQSFVIAGLVNQKETDSYNKLPGLGNLPIFGALFKSRESIKTRTDLVVIVTPEITNPLNANDPKPSIYFPKDFLVRLDPKDLVSAAGKNSKKPTAPAKKK